MKKEQWKKEFSDAMDELRDEYVQESAEEEPPKMDIRGRGKRIFGIAAGLAAAAAVAIAVLFSSGVIQREKPAESIPDSSAPESAVPVVSLSPASTENVPAEGTETAAAAETEAAALSLSETAAPEADAIPVVRLVSPEYPQTAKITSEKDFENEELLDREWQEQRARNETAKALEGVGREFSREMILRMIGESDDENPLCSPANLYLALTLLAECGEGNTRAQILEALALPDQKSARETAQNLVLANYIDNGLIKSRFSDSLWLNRGLNYHEDTLIRLRDQYFASVFQGNMGDPAYDQALRDWVNEETGGFLRDRVSGLEMNPEGALDLLSTLYLRAMWTTPFLPERTEDGVFHGTHGDAPASFMHSDSDRTYYYAEHFGAVSLGLGNEFTMWLLLPDEGIDVRSLCSDEEALDLLLRPQRERYEIWSGKNAYVTVHLALPKFDISAENDLKEILQAMGITDAFSEDRADFSNLCDSADPVFLSAVKNGIRIAIDEEGLTAASYINMALAGAAEVTEEVDFTLDRPFMYCVTGNGGIPLFTGIVEQY